MCVVIGVDIGKTGWAARLGPGMAPLLRPLPFINDGEPRKRIVNGGERLFQPVRLDGRKTLDLFHSMAPAGHSVLVVFENVLARLMNNDKKQFNNFYSQNLLVMTRGALTAAIDIAGFRSEAVQPQTWKALYGLGGADKSDGRAMAARLYPALASEFRLVKDHDKADAMLIAHFGLKKLT